MIRPFGGRRVWLSAVACLALIAFAVPASAQTGLLKGTVKDSKGQPVEGAKITIDFQGGMNRHQEVKSDKRGEFVQVGLPLGNYKVVAVKEGVGGQVLMIQVKATGANELAFVLSPAAGAGGGAGAVSKEEAAKRAAVSKAFDEGVAAMKAGNNDEAIAKFKEGAAADPKCSDCFMNLGIAYASKKDYPNAEDAYKKAIEARPDFADAYSNLANVYNAEKKFDDAAAAGAKANELATSGAGAGGAGGPINVNATYNQGVILWNSQKFAEAKTKFEAVVKADPNHAEAHYMYGMALLNEGKLPDAGTEMEAYLKLAPDGPNAATAKAVVAQVKK